MADPSTPTAVAILAVLATALMVATIASWRATPYPFSQYLLHEANRFFAQVVWRGEVVGSIDLPRTQGAVIVSNHGSGIDPLLIQLSTELRIVHWMVAREYYFMPLFSIIFKGIKCIPVNRGGIDTAATKMAIRYAHEGGLVGLFPEGRVNTTDQLLLPGRPGAALIALRARVPVIPMYVEGAPYDGTALGSFFMTAKARVIIGKPIDLSTYFGRDNDKAVPRALTLLFLEEIAKLAGCNDFEAQLAGRHWNQGQEDASQNGRSEAAPAHAAKVASDDAP
jgi:1-acyl-sn-glycerol-3-phosphate acyltransferase